MDINESSAVFGPVHRNVSRGAGQCLLSSIVMTCLTLWKC